jgi:two-component system sensor histidine kinase DesK
MVSLATEKDQGELDQQWTSNNSSDKRSSPVEELKEMIAASGISVRLWRLYAYFWFICLFFPILSLIQTPPPGVHLLIIASGLIVFVGIYFWIMWPHPLSDRARTRLGMQKSVTLIIGLTVLVLFLSIIYGSLFLWLFIGVNAIAGITLSFRSAFIAVTGLTLLTLGANISMDGGITTANWLQIIPLALLVRGLGLDMIGFVRLSDALRELQRARGELAHQAVMEERLRMARDLHDLLGHSLSLITLKSALAGRLLEKNPPAATEQVHEVERVARQALREVREAVAGYRQRTLRSELDGARQILDVREGVTNVIRHSRAQHCRIHITSSGGYIRAEISNDGYPRKETTTVEWGSGLSGLSERVSNEGGKLEVERQPTSNGPGFQLSVELPTRSNLTTEGR